MWNNYPRPQLVRNSYFNLNGQWEFEEITEGEDVTFTDSGIAEFGKMPVNIHYSERIEVPFVPQSSLSGLERDIHETSVIAYRRTFTLPSGFLPEGHTLLINFDAVDQRCIVLLNGRIIGHFANGYTRFTCRVPGDLVKDINILEVLVRDTISDQIYPRGKQSNNPHGMWYTPCTGIWQSVWAEAVPEEYVESVRITTSLNHATVRIRCRNAVTGEIIKNPAGTLVLKTPALLSPERAGYTTPYNYFNEYKMPSVLNEIPFKDGVCEIDFDAPLNWTPEEPYLYLFDVKTGEDTVGSYLGLRTLATGLVKGVNRLLLNGKPYYFHGVLDQGYYIKGLFTTESPENYKKDIRTMKEMGFNTLRKHIKVEPDIFYYLCDCMGMVVFQDMVNNGSYSYLRDTIMPTLCLNKHQSDVRMNRNPETRNAFIKAMRLTVRQLYNHPSICYWTIFNEGWGQFCGNDLYDILREMDSTRIIDTASGWYICENSDVFSPHVYFRKVKIKKNAKPIVVSEYGGYALSVAEHHAGDPKKAYGYKDFTKPKDYEDALCTLFETEILPAIKQGLCGDIYTQLSDVENEINGLVTYNRKAVKVNPARLADIAARMYDEIAR
ncbi:MAG: hypothetical protein E7241_03400 [Lachnospiraceae bacterium]|nr:hypothetical protein [Lachnospiraceae bacterium]